jgi:steroid 5-alpha reductase family enzyme
MNIQQAWSVAFPQTMLILLIICAAICAIGFIKFVYFISVGYGFAIAGAGAALIVIYAKEMSVGSFLLCILLVIYGIRLGGFLLYREIKSVSYRKTLSEVTNDGKPTPAFFQVIIWIMVTMLYVAQVSPVFYRLNNGRASGVMPIIGAMVMTIAILIETIADRQKSLAKKENPNHFCKTGLYKIVRCPNYFGEVLFWTGVFLSCIGALAGLVQWIVAVIGYLSILYVMFSGSKRLELRQNKKYGDSEEYKEYVKKTPILLPYIPIYTLAEVNFIKA